ncbi:phosphopantetheine-binding protein [Nocardioides sp. B-3]|uniref:phosphopantetheine-binding protein n=1 Tax=Nocardioides sp. B-3 TaxID=2895565 RepID=UPI0021524904|nr:phosphopantetheine-binding protein [Nocardioides sp. B-3]UUZ61668.1 phosphopantetheine-binding protein [Nocardioides sp. B-3]
MRSTKSGNKLLVGYLTVDETYDATTAQELLRTRLPAALVPRLAVVEELPTRTSGKVDRDALPWPLPKIAAAAVGLDELQQWLADIWADVLGADVTSPKDDFFAFGGGSLTAARVVSRIRERFPEIVVGDVYAHPSIAALADALPAFVSSRAVSNRDVRPLPLKSRAGQLLAPVPLRSLAGLRWLSWLLLGSAIAGPLLDLDWLPTTPIWVLVLTTWFFPGPAGTDDAGRRARAPGAPSRHCRGAPPRRQGPPADLAGRAHPGTSSTRRRWPAPRGFPSTPACSATTSVRAPTCTRCRP